MMSSERRRWEATVGVGTVLLVMAMAIFVPDHWWQDALLGVAGMLGLAAVERRLGRGGRNGGTASIAVVHRCSWSERRWRW
jgi:hypothetical protein